MKIDARLSVIAAGVLASTVMAGGNVNLLSNGSFEEHVVNGSWNLFDDLPGWSLLDGPGIELQRGVGGWDAYDGEQWLELDSDQNGPGGGFINGEIGSSSITQEAQTVVGQYYMLTLGFSPRPGVEDNHLAISWNSDLIYEVEASGVGLQNTSWQEISILIQADSTSSFISLADHSFNDTLGTFVDGVSLVAVPAPATLALLMLPALKRRRRRT
ncbi:MAG: hypothetical protein CMJ40_05770 [Phycisphaerae bacterium]|nr:hypothetical protein [Phycisphaerae bacterium]